MRRFIALALIVMTFGVRAEVVSLVMTDVRLVDLIRIVYGEMRQEPFVMSPEVAEFDKRFTLDLRKVKESQATSALVELAKQAGFTVAKRSGVVWIGKTLESDDELIVYKPRFRSARYLADVVQGVTSARSVLSRSLRQVPQGGAVQDIPQSPGANVSPTSVEGQVDRSEVDQIAFNVVARDAAKVRQLLRDLDTVSGEVVLKAAVYEVGLTRREGSALNIAASVLSSKGLTLSGGVLDGVGLKVSLGGLDAVLSALDADVRFKSISRPQVRVSNGSKARFSVGQDVPVLGNVQIDRSGNPLQSVEYKQSGIILTALPEIRENVIELTMQQELSNFVVTKTGVNGSPTLIKRSVDTKLGINPGEVVVMAGLQDVQEDSTNTRLPVFGYLFGQDKQFKDSEILIFVEAVRI